MNTITTTSAAYACSEYLRLLRELGVSDVDALSAARMLPQLAADSEYIAAMNADLERRKAVRE